MQRCCCHPAFAPPEYQNKDLQNGEHDEPYLPARIKPGPLSPAL